MSRRQVRVEYSGATEMDIDEPLIVDDLGADPTDDEIDKAIRTHISDYMENAGDVQPVDHEYKYDRDALIASVRAEIERRKTEEEE